MSVRVSVTAHVCARHDMYPCQYGNIRDNPPEMVKKSKYTFYYEYEFTRELPLGSIVCAWGGVPCCRSRDA